jgi:hypothetical protein
MGMDAIVLPLLESQTDSTMWAFYALSGITLVYVAFVRPFFKKQKDPLQRTPQFGLAHQRKVEEQMSNLLVELSEMARKITAQLDTRATRLELLIDQADQRLAELKRLMESVGNISPSAGPATMEIDPRHAEIYAMADRGLGVHDIAQKTQRPHGEIELILALRPKVG